jgi:threonine/homoserine/homoserine lactone efflux protein
MLTEAAGFAILATISPTALAVMTVFLGSDNPRRAALMYVAGAMVMSVLMAVALLFVIRATGLNLPRGYEPRYGLRLALGILAVASGVVVGIRMPRKTRESKESRESPEDKPGKSVVSRLVREPTASAAFVAGLIVFAPGTTFIAAVQVIATADVNVTRTAAGLAIVVVLSAMIPWLPLLAYLAAPDTTTRRLRAANRWLRVHGKALTVAVLAICGIALILNGALGLATRRLALPGGYPCRAVTPAGRLPLPGR